MTDIDIANVTTHETPGTPAPFDELASLLKVLVDKGIVTANEVQAGAVIRVENEVKAKR